jgi:hypothetical protein
VTNFKVSSDENIELIEKIAKLDFDHQSVAEENENLRVELNEILEKLRDYEGSSERTIINPATLEKLIYILDFRNARVVSDITEVLQLKLLMKELSDKTI